MANSLGTANQFIWSENADFSNPLNNPSDSTITVSADGTYYIMADNGLCSAEDTVQVLFEVSPEAQFEVPDSIGCAPLMVSFANQSIQTDYFLWDFGNGVVDSVNFDPEIQYTEPGVYTVSLYIFDSLCPASDTTFTTITVLPNITVSGLDSITLCLGDEINVTANSDGTATAFNWSSNAEFSDILNPSGGSTITVISTGTYYVELSNSECSLIDSVFVEFVDPEILLAAEDSICLYDFSDISVENLSPGVDFTYEWEPGTIITADNNESIQVQPLTSQYVYVTATTAGNCIVEDSIFINVTNIDSSLVIASASEYAVPEGATVTLFGSPSGLSSYQWTPEEGLNAPTNQQTEAVINEDIIYTLSVSDGICSRDDTVEIKVYEIICEDPFVFVPNAFSPNGDNYNDVLYVRGLYIEKVIFRIFNRWGEMVFESNDLSLGWDGMFKNQLLQPDVYDFYLDVTCVGGLTSIVKGNITLMR
jgi:gliding motility-associated-like protein